MGDQHHLEDESKPSSSPEAVTFLFWNSLKHVQQMSGNQEIQQTPSDRDAPLALTMFERWQNLSFQIKITVTA